MIIHVYTICWNEEKILPFFIRHYQQFAEQIFFYDNESDDNSRKIIESSEKCYYRSYLSGNEIRDDIYKEIKNNVWKESRGVADFVIVVDTDEFVYSKWNLISYLKVLKFFGFTLIRLLGYDMITEKLDWNSTRQITELVKEGTKFRPMNKPCIFNPDKIAEINFSNGAHSCKATGKTRIFRADFLGKYFDPRIYLLHYKLMGLDYVSKRNIDLKIRLSSYNKEHKLGFHYNEDAITVKNNFEKKKAVASKVI